MFGDCLRSVFLINSKNKKIKENLLFDKVVIISFDAGDSRLSGGWPVPRSEHVRLINKLTNYNPSSMLYAIVFEDRMSEKDKSMLELVRSESNVWWMLAESEDQFMGEPLHSFAGKNFFSSSVTMLDDSSWQVSSWDKKNMNPTISYLLAKEIYGDFPQKDKISKVNKSDLITLKKISVGELFQMENHDLFSLLSDKIVIIVRSYSEDLVSQDPDLVTIEVNATLNY
jgi:hypothetical protein